MTARLAGAIAAVAMLAVSPARAQSDSIETLVARASNYVASFITRFSSIVASEEYLQDISYTAITGSGGFAPGSGTTRMYRQLTSDFLLVKPTDASTVVAFRDVIAIDGQPVPDRDARLVRLFIDAAGSDLERARAIAAESAKYNLGRIIRDNNPLMVVGFLQPAYVDRFRFTLGRGERIDGRDAAVLSYVETARPTLLTSPQLLGEGARGRVWIEPATGRPLRTELATRLVTVTTRFALDEQLGIDVPVEMVEAYRQGNSNTVLARGTAKYGRFRRFGVSVSDQIQNQ